MLIFYLSCLFLPNMEGLGHFRLSDNSMGNQVTISDIKMDLIVWGFADAGHICHKHFCCFRWQLGNLPEGLEAANDQPRIPWLMDQLTPGCPHHSWANWCRPISKILPLLMGQPTEPRDQGHDLRMELGAGIHVPDCSLWDIYIEDLIKEVYIVLNKLIPSQT